MARSAEEEVIAIPSVHPTDPPVAYAVESEDGFKAAVITGLRVEEVEKGVTFDDGASVVLANSPVSSGCVSLSVQFHCEFQL